MPTAADVRRITIVAIALGFEHRVDRATDLRHRDAGDRGSDARIHGAHHQRVLAGKLVGGVADHDGAADLCQLAAIARRDLGEDNVTRLQSAACRGRHRAIVRPGAQHQEIVLGAERFHLPLERYGKLVLAQAGARDFEEVAVAKLGDARSRARVGDLLGGLCACGVEHDVVRRPHLRKCGGDVACDLRGQGTQAGDAGRRVRAHASLDLR